MPDLIISLMKIIINLADSGDVKLVTSQLKDNLYIFSLPNIRNLDPIACIIKYFTADSLSDILF
jgi:hypothetical protein